MIDLFVAAGLLMFLGVVCFIIEAFIMSVRMEQDAVAETFEYAGILLGGIGALLWLMINFDQWAFGV